MPEDETLPQTKPRPQWAEAIYDFITDEVIDEKYGYPSDGSADTLHSEIENAVLDILCRTYGHEIVDDHCMKPDHRYCVYCHRRETAIAADADSRTVTLAWLMWCYREGYIRAEDRAPMTNWMLHDPSMLTPLDLEERDALLAMAAEVLAVVDA